jgi:hypothetical protein
MIKPQGKIRPHFHSDIEDDVDMVRVSLDSYGGEVLSRDEKGGEQSLKVPDCTVVKATASLHDDRVLMIVEVKRVEMTLKAAKEQLAEYFGSLVDKGERFDGQPLFDHLEGLLVVGKDVLLARLPTPGGVVNYSSLHDITGGAVHDFLMGITSANW